MIRLLLAVLLLMSTAHAQQQDPVQALSPRVRAMLPLFPPPSRGDVSVTTRFSADSVFTGEQVELVTATWFARDLLAILRRQPSLRAPTLSGLWSTQAVSFPSLTLSKVINGRIFDLYLTHQTLFPLGSTTIEAPAAELNYSVPLTNSFFSPEERRTVLSKPAKLVVRTVPPKLLSALGTGPTARDLSLQWRGPAAGLRAGTPSPLELVIRGSGNLTLWPAPEIAWPAGTRVYPEPTVEGLFKGSALIGGEKRFRFTVVVDSAGVLGLPGVRYPYFDPRSHAVKVATAASFVLPVAPSAGPGANRKPLPLEIQQEIPFASRLVQRFAVPLWLIAFAPLLHLLWLRRRRPPIAAEIQSVGDPEAELRRRLGTPLDAAPDRVSTALRRRGIPRKEAESVRQWMTGAVRNRYGPTPGPSAAAPTVLQQILARLKSGLGVVALFLVVSHLSAQSDAVNRYNGGDYPAAAVEFERAVAEHPAVPSGWGNLAAARWMQGDDVGAAAAWLNALALAPREATVRSAWRSATTLPVDIRQKAPTLPITVAELSLVVLAGWLGAWVFWLKKWRKTAATVLVLTAVLGVGTWARWVTEREPRALIREGAVLRVSPTPSAPMLGSLRVWTVARVTRTLPGWYLVDAGSQGEGWVPVASAAQLGPAAPADPGR